MISSFTPPGTEIVSIVDDPPENGLPGLTRGRIYVVEKILPTAAYESERFGVVLHGHGIGTKIVRVTRLFGFKRVEERRTGYSLRNFRYLEKAATPEFYEAAAPLGRGVAPERQASE